MDDRVADLLGTFPEIFERRVPSLEDIEEKWVIIVVPEDQTESEAPSAAEEDLFVDLERFEVGFDDQRRDTDIPAYIDVPLPEGVDINRGSLTEIVLRPRPRVIGKLRRKIKGRFPGSPAGISGRELVPPPDALAVYLPFHRYPEMWGIYLLDAGVASLATDLQRIMRLLGSSISNREALKLAQVYLFHHEAYHCAVESFALRCELPMRRPVYRTGLRKLYVQPWSWGEPHEETLATAYGIRKVRDNLRLPPADLTAAIDALRVYMTWCSPPYAAGVSYLSDTQFDELERQFMEEGLRLSTRRALAPSAWTMGTQLMSPLIQRNRKYAWICDRADFRKRSRLSVHYFRRRDVISCLERLADVKAEAGGRHLHLVREYENGAQRVKRRTQVPSGEIPRGTLGGMLKDLGLELNVHEFRDECQKAGKRLS